MTDLFLMLRDSIDFVMDLTYIEVWGISVFEVALMSFLSFTMFRFLISPLIGGSFSWRASESLSDSVKISNANKQKENISNRIGFR